MGAGASAEAPPFKSAEEALAAGKTQAEIDAWMKGAGVQSPEAEAAPAEAAEAEAAPAEAAKAEAAPAEAAKAEEAAPAEGASITDISMKDAVALINEKKYLESNAWPLFLDGTDEKGFISFLGYQSFHLLEVKKAIADVNINKTKTVEQVREEWRKIVVDCMIQKSDLGSSPGRPLWLHFANSAVSFKETYCGGDLSIDLFDAAAMQAEETKKSFIKDGEASPLVWGPEFQVFLTSEFSKEDAVEFLEDAIPLDKLKIYHVVNN